MMNIKAYSRIMSILFVSALLLWPLPVAAQTSITYTSADFGDVVVDTSKKIVVSIENTGSAITFDYSLPVDKCGFIASGSRRITLLPDGTTDITLEWTPSVAGQCSTEVQILNVRAIVSEITVTGNAITEAAKKSLPDIAGLVSAFEQWVQNGDIVGKGWGKSAGRHLNAFRRMLVRAKNLMDRGHTKRAFHQLRATLKLTRPLIIGSAVGELREIISEALAGLKNDMRGAVVLAEENAPELDLLLASFDEWVASGDIEGKGHGKYARRHLDEYKDMLVKANDLVERGHSKKAYLKLVEARKLAGHFITGDAVDDLSEMISEVLESLKA